jgi:hypothetical protein
MFTINIIDDTNCVSESFVKANSFILEKYSDKFFKNTDNSQLLKDLWLLEYKAILNSTFIEFKKNIDMTMFLLRWS